MSGICVLGYICLPDIAGQKRNRNREVRVKETVVYYGLELLPVCAALSVFGLIKVICATYQPQRKILTTYQELAGFIREKGQIRNWYQRKERWLAQNGGTFYYGSRMTPAKFLGIRFMLAALGMVAFASFSWEYGLVACLVFYFLPVWLLLYRNGKDNEKLLPELKLIYHALEIQIRAGVYVTDALAECYGSVQEKRLRKALLELAGDIVMKADIYDALNKFQGKFENRYVDSLCITVLQALESGQAVELLGDIGEQLKDMEGTVMERKKSALDRSITFYQLGILAVIMAIALYACIKYMFGAATGF